MPGFKKPKRSRRVPRPRRSKSFSVRGRGPALNPAPINSQPTFQRSLTWMGALSTTSVSITRACLLSSLVLISSGTNVASTTFPCLMTSLRIKSVKVWTPAVLNAGGNMSVNGVSFQWLSDLGPETKTTRVALGSVATSFSTVPPPLSRADQWSRANAQTSTLEEVLFTLSTEETSQIGDIYIQISLEFKTAEASPGRLNVGFVTTDTLAFGMYQMWLDSLTPSNAIGTLSLAPVGISVPCTAASISTLSRTS